jgi:hypothetical protein
MYKQKELFAPNNGRFKILSRNGFEDFIGIKKTSDSKNMLRIFISDNTYIIKRKRYAAVRNPYKERVAESYDQNQEIAENNGTIEVNEDLSEYSPKSNKSAERIKDKLDKNKTPIYQNLNKNTKVDNVNRYLNKDKNKLNNKTTNQNINITRNTNINNPSKEKAAELDAQVKMAKLQQKQSQGGGVNEKLIEIQKTNPLKPLSMDGR